MCEAVRVGFGPQVSHGVRGQSNVESRRICLRTVGSTSPAMTSCGTPCALSGASRSVLAKAPHARLVTAMSLGCRPSFGEKVGPSLRIDSLARLLDAARSTSGHIDQDQGQV